MYVDCLLLFVGLGKGQIVFPQCDKLKTTYTYTLYLFRQYFKRLLSFHHFNILLLKIPFLISNDANERGKRHKNFTFKMCRYARVYNFFFTIEIIFTKNFVKLISRIISTFHANVCVVCAKGQQRRSPNCLFYWCGPRLPIFPMS